MATISASDAENSVSAEITSDNMNAIDTPTTIKNINEEQINDEKVLSTDKVISGNEEIQTSNLKTSDETGNFLQLQKIIDETESYGTLFLTRDYNADSAQETINITKSITIDGNGHTLDASFMGFIFNIQSDNVTIQNIKLVNGDNYNLTGAIYWNASNGKLLDSVLTNNFGKDGGAVHLAKGNNMINNTIFYSNSAVMFGGAVYVGREDTIITNNLFVNNQALFGKNYALYTPNDEYIGIYENNTFINNTRIDFGGDDSDEIINYKDKSSSHNQKHEKGGQFALFAVKDYSKQNSHDVIVVKSNNKEIPIGHNKLTLDLLNKIFNQNFTNGRLLIYMDGELIFNGTTTDDLSQLIYNFIDMSGNHEIKVEFTDKEGKTSTFTENISA